MEELIYGFDLGAFNAVFSLHNWLLDSLMKLITQLGDSALVWIVCAIMLILPRKTRRSALSIAGALVLVLVVCDFMLKGLAARPRPCDYPPWQGGLFVYPSVIPTPGTFSYPSGHAATSFAAATVLQRGKGKRAFPAWILAALIAFSRVYLGVGYLTDVIAGAIIGTFCALIAATAFDFVFERCRRAGFKFTRYIE